MNLYIRPVTCHPDIYFAAIKLSQYSASPVLCHFAVVTDIFRFLKATEDDGIYNWRKQPQLDLSKEEIPHAKRMTIMMNSRSLNVKNVMLVVSQVPSIPIMLAAYLTGSPFQVLLSYLKQNIKRPSLKVLLRPNSLLQSLLENTFCIYGVYLRKLDFYRRMPQSYLKIIKEHFSWQMFNVPPNARVIWILGLSACRIGCNVIYYF